MIFQLFAGSLLLMITVVLASTGFWLTELVTDRIMLWATRPPHALKLSLMLIFSAVIVLAITALSVWTWAFGFLFLGVFDQLEPAVYFTLVSFTTLGFGDIILPVEWRILGGMTALNGLLNIGIFAAMMVEVLRRVRTEQRNR